MQDDVQFSQEDQELYHFRSRQILGEAVPPKLVIWLVKHHVVRSERAAGMLLIVVILAALGLSFYFYKIALGF